MGLKNQPQITPSSSEIHARSVHSIRINLICAVQREHAVRKLTEPERHTLGALTAPCAIYR